MIYLVLKNFKTGKKLLTSANWLLRQYILRSVHFQHQVLITVWKKIKFPFQWCINQPLLRRKKIHLKNCWHQHFWCNSCVSPLKFLITDRFWASVPNFAILSQFEVSQHFLMLTSVTKYDIHISECSLRLMMCLTMKYNPATNNFKVN